MEFFILLPGDDEKDLLNDINKLGEISFKNFWAATGFKILENIIRKNDEEIINMIKILDSGGKQYSIEQFFEYISKYKILFQ